MIIANPIYDTVFKRLMENERLSRFFIGTLLEQNIVSLVMNPQEYTYRVDPEAESVQPEKQEQVSEREVIGYSIFRVDFIATILTESGEHRKILIEVQKAWDKHDLLRFRNYLAGQYRKVDTVNGVQVALPITTIYVLDFKLPEVESACVKVEREYQDMISRKPIAAKSPFIEKLTHDSYVVQVRRIASDRYQTRLDKLLSVFEQANFVGDTEMLKIYNHHSDDENVKEMTEMTELLHHMGSDPEERRQLEIEQEAIRTLNALFGKQNRIIEEQDRALGEKDRALEEKDRVIEEDKKIIGEKDRALGEKDKALEEKDKAIAALKRQLEELQRQSHEK
jgi:hypothetical protein